MNAPTRYKVQLRRPCFDPRLARTLLAASLVTTGATAAPGPSWLLVERAPGTEACPDARTLAEAVGKLSVEPQASDGALLQVQFWFLEGRLRANLHRVGSASSPRELQSHPDDTQCKALSAAVTTTAALFLDTQLEMAAPNPIAPPKVPPDVLPVEEPSAAEVPLEWTLGAAMGTPVNDVALPPFLAIDIGLQQWPYRGNIGSWLSGSESRDYGPGRVEVRMNALSTQGCFGLLRGLGFSSWLCSGAEAGLFTAQALGYTEDQKQSVYWIGAPLGLEVEQRFLEGQRTALSLRAGAGLLFPLTPRTFSIEGLGIAAELDDPMLLVWLGLETSNKF